MSTRPAFLADLIDACVMECYFRGHMAERDLLFHDNVACPTPQSRSGANSGKGTPMYASGSTGSTTSWCSSSSPEITF